MAWGPTAEPQAAAKQPEGTGAPSRARRAAHRCPARQPVYDLGVGPGIRRLEVYNVVQEHFAVVQLVAPNADGLEGERALAQAGDHRFAAGLNTLGDGGLALAREQPDRAHLAQIQAHRVVGALDRLLGLYLVSVFGVTS